MKHLFLFEQYLTFADLEAISERDADFEYHGYLCKIPYIPKRQAYGVQVYKNGEYKMAIKGWLPLEKAIAKAKQMVDGHITRSLKKHLDP